MKGFIICILCFFPAMLAYNLLGDNKIVSWVVYFKSLYPLCLITASSVVLNYTISKKYKIIIWGFIGYWIAYILINIFQAIKYPVIEGCEDCVTYFTVRHGVGNIALGTYSIVAIIILLDVLVFSKNTKHK